MKKLAVAATVMVLSLSLYSQDYGNICTKGVTLYLDTAGNLQGFRYDSLQVTPDHDSVFTSFPTLLYNSATGLPIRQEEPFLAERSLKRMTGGSCSSIRMGIPYSLTRDQSNTCSGNSSICRITDISGLKSPT